MQLKSPMNIKKLFEFGFKTLLNAQVAMLLVLVLSIVYFFGYDTAYLSSNKKLTQLEEERKKLDEEMKSKQQEVDRLKQWEEELKGLETEIPEIKADSSSRVMAITESKKIVDLAQGIGRDTEQFPLLQAPHDKLQVVNFALVGEEQVQVNDEAVAIPLEATKASAPAEKEGHAATKPTQALILSKFDYNLTVKGTYPALVDLINQVAQSHNLVTIQKLNLKLAPLKEGQAAQTLGEDPNEPVILEMSMLFSLYFYEPNKK